MTGFINVNKGQGISSAAEVGKVKRILNTPCGHMGTLDPMATGVLPIAIGNAARLFDFFLDKHKTYVAEFKFGVDSDTLDTTGKMLETAGYVPTNAQIESVLNKFVGAIEQVPPKFSAKNINGKRGYELARTGVDFELAPKTVNVYSLKLLRQTEKDSFEFEIECGGGTYIRSLARDIAAELGTCAVMSSLKRTKSGCFHIENAVETKILTKENISEYIIPTENVLPFEKYFPSEKAAFRLFNGLSAECDLKDGIYKIYNLDGVFYGLAEANHSTIKVRKKLC